MLCGRAYVPCLLSFYVDIVTTEQRSGGLFPIPSFRFGQLSYEEFYASGPHSDRPLIISGIPPSESPCFGELVNDSQHLLSMLEQNCDGIIRLDKMSPLRSRTGKRPFHNADFKHFVRWMQGIDDLGKLSTEHGPILGLEYCIQANCKRSFWERFRVPAFFTGDVSLRTKYANVPYGEDPAYPALTFSESGFYTRGHVDMPNNEIWMGMCYGHKTVRVLPVSIVAKHWGRGAHLERLAYGRLNEDGTVVLNLMFKTALDLFNDTFIADELPGVPIYEGRLQGGELLYLPTSQAHAVLSHDRGLYVISSWVDLNSVITPNPNQLLIKLASCQRCTDGIKYMINYSLAHGGQGEVLKCRRRMGCAGLVSWLLDDRLRVPLVDYNARDGTSTKDQRIRPRRNPPILQVMQAGSETVRRQRVRQWFA